ncbi:MAG TPA: hypothetical protein VFA93_02930 [Patescibacteria group bacterium]|nr:hypothetical protein [Patescibacteria group bacterium]
MTIKAQTTFKIPFIEGEFNWTRTLRDGSTISVLDDQNAKGVVCIVDDGEHKYVTVFEDGYQKRVPHEQINLVMQHPLRTRFGEIKIWYEPTLPSQARK